MRVSAIDLHCHSTHSDGELGPREVVMRAAQNGVKVLALTDHDTISGLDEASEAASSADIQLVTGIELSCEWRGYTIHILGLNFPWSNKKVIEEAQDQQLQARQKRAEEIALRLCKKGLPDILSQAIEASESGVPGRPHFARVLAEEGLVSSEAEAFKKYLGAGKAGDVKSMWPSLETVMHWITSSGAVGVIAHPRKYNMSLTKLRELIEEFKELGGQALEVIVAGQKQGEIGVLSDLCRRFDLLASVGSDFHSPRFPWADLGKIPKLPSSVTPVWHNWENIVIDS